MEVKVENQEGLDALLTVKVFPEDYKEGVAKGLKEYGRQLKVPGFRPGKVPMGIVKKMVEKDLKQEEIQKKVNEGIVEHLKESKTELLLQPVLKESPAAEDYRTGDSFRFVYEAGLKPDFEPNLSALEGTSRFKPVLKEEDIIKEIDLIRRQKGAINRHEEVVDSENTNLVLKIEELNDNGEALEGGVNNIRVHSLKQLKPKLQDLLPGKKVEESFEINLKEIYTIEELAKLLEITENTAQDLGENFRISINSVFKLDPAEMSKEFFSGVLGREDIENEEDFLAEVRKRIEEHYEVEADRILFKEFHEKIIENTNIELPGKFLETWYHEKYDHNGHEHGEENGNNHEQPALHEIVKELKWDLIAEKLYKESGKDIQQEEIINYTRSLFAREFSRAGMPPDESAMANYVTNYLQDINNVTQVRATIRDNKVFEYLKEKTETVENEVSKEEFDKLNAE